MNQKFYLFLALAIFLISPLAEAAEIIGSLETLKNILFSSILPIFAVMGLGFAAFSFLTGSPNAKQHLTYAITGAAICFGAQSIADLLERIFG